MRAYEIEFAKAGTAHTPMIVLLPYFTTAGSLLAFLSGVLAATGKGDLDRRVEQQTP